MSNQLSAVCFHYFLEHQLYFYDKDPYLHFLLGHNWAPIHCANCNALLLIFISTDQKQQTKGENIFNIFFKKIVLYILISLLRIKNSNTMACVLLSQFGFSILSSHIYIKII